MSIVFAVVAGMLSAAALITVFRLLKGPTTLDRVVATDMVLAIILCSLAALAAVRTDGTVAPVILIGTLLGFLGSVAIARMIGQRST